MIRRADVSDVTPEMTCVAEIVNGPSHRPEVWALKFVVAYDVVELPALMYVSEVTFVPLRITPVAEATDARKSVAIGVLIRIKQSLVACGVFTRCK